MEEIGEPVIVRAFIDRDPDTTEPAWTATVMAADPALDKLFASGESFQDARIRLARVVLDAVRGHHPQQSVTAVRVFAMTRKTYDVDALDALD